MFLLTFVGGFIVGAVVQQAWGNHRIRYYKRVIKKLLDKAEENIALNDEMINRLNRADREEDINRMRIGVTNAIANMADEIGD